MPLRIRCHCGQDLVVRRSEWVYFFLGLGAVGLVALSLIAVLLWIDNRQLRSQLEAAGFEARASHPERAERDAVPTETPPAVTSEAPVDAPSEDDVDTEGDHILGAPKPALDASSDLLTRLRRQIRTEPAAPPPDESPPQATESPVPPAALGDLFGEAPILARLLLEQHAENPLLQTALLTSTDRSLRRAAVLELARHWPSTPPPGVREVVEAARANFVELPGGDALAARLAETASGASVLDLDAAVEQLRLGVDELIAADSSLRLFRERLRSLREAGVDVVLALDTTESMDRGLESLTANCRWLLPLLAEQLEGVRVGWLFYKDEVTETVDFDEHSPGTWLARLAEIRAEGGGDVPEGVDAAIRASLELGRFDWRPGAEKRIVLLGDAPPRYATLDATESLLRAAHSEAAFAVHFFGLFPQENDTVPFFERLAAAGGGRQHTPTQETLGSELLEVVLGTGHRSVLERIVELVR